MQHPSMLPQHPSVRRVARPPLPSGSEYLRRQRQGVKSPETKFQHRDHTPSSWSEYFTSRRDVALDDETVFRVYFSEDSNASPESMAQTPLLLLLHGGGFSGLTWALFAREITQICHVRVAAIDLRGHGATRTKDDQDLSVETITNDITRVLRALYLDRDMPEIILMGHSMGGALAVHFADLCSDEEINSRLVGLVVIDVVEGTAKESLASMHQVLRGRPTSFRSLEYAIEWYLRSGQSRNLEASKVSMPGQLQNKSTGLCACDMDKAVQDDIEQANRDQPSSSSSFGLETLAEDGQMPAPPTRSAQASDAYVWRANLAASEKYWSQWFDRLSEIFLGPKGGAKLLLLAGTDRLDGPMTVGQMQGKFQMQILPKVGHTIQEDDPEAVAHVVGTYLVRNRFTVLKTESDYPLPSC